MQRASPLLATRLRVGSWQKSGVCISPAFNRQEYVGNAQQCAASRRALPPKKSKPPSKSAKWISAPMAYHKPRGHCQTVRLSDCQGFSALVSSFLNQSATMAGGVASNSPKRLRASSMRHSQASKVLGPVGVAFHSSLPDLKAKTKFPDDLPRPALTLREASPVFTAPCSKAELCTVSKPFWTRSTMPAGMDETNHLGIINFMMFPVCSTALLLCPLACAPAFARR